jgi:hypothetical protein
MTKNALIAFALWFGTIRNTFAQEEVASESPEVELLPIISYDTDAGIGLGTKVFALNYLMLDESFDLILFNSSKGERWYRLVFSLPDFERRQGKVYPMAVDATVNYDKTIRASFFGVGSTSRYENREYFTKEPIDFNVL